MNEKPKEKIKELMKEIKDICKEANIPFFAKFQLATFYYNVWADEGFNNAEELKALHDKWLIINEK
jgi:hypothetical protein